MISFFIIPIIIGLAIIVGLVSFISYLIRRKKHKSGNFEKSPFVAALSKEDAVSQSLFLLAVFFLGTTFFALNRDFGSFLQWQTILLLAIIPAILLSYYYKLIYVLIFSLVGFCVWWAAAYSQWGSDGGKMGYSALFAGLFILAAFYYCFGTIHETRDKYKRFALVYMILGIFLSVGLLFFFSSKPGLEVLEDASSGEFFWASWRATTSLFVFMIFLVASILYAIKNNVMGNEAVAVIALVLLFGMVAFVPHQQFFIRGSSYSLYGRSLSSAGIFWAVIFNIALFGQILGLIFLGYYKKTEWMVNMGAVFMVGLVIVKYFDWFFTFLNKSIFFIGAGVLLFGLGWLMERSRRRMISEIRQDQHMESASTVNFVNK